MRVLGAAGLLAAGATGMWFYLRASSKPTPALAFSPPAVAAIQEPQSDMEVTLAADALGRTRLKTSQVEVRPLMMTVRVPGVVQSNGYREVQVTPLVGGVITKAFAELGTPVKQGAPLAKIFSTELAEAQTHLLNMKAELNAEHLKLKRTQELLAIGAASRQELEGVQATHAVHESHARAAQQKLLLLGLSEEQIAGLESARQINSDVTVPAPIDGIVLSRMVNLGQVVAIGQPLFTVTDLSTVWVIADVFEKDFAVVRVGSRATITTPAYPGRVYHGKVSYIDPRIDQQTRTAKVRVEVTNPGIALKLGMYVDVSFQTPGGSLVPVVPGNAVQSIGSKQVVYLPVEGDPSRFLQRTVRLGEQLGADYRVIEGLKADDKVVSEGSFFLRAESLRQNPSQ
jgi:RND family efflux transporter MFP subunit